MRKRAEKEKDAFLTHPSSSQPHRCDQCPQAFNVEFNLTLHKSTHTTSDFTCPVCNKKFSRIASLKSHIMLHEKEEVSCPASRAPPLSSLEVWPLSTFSAPLPPFCLSTLQNLICAECGDEFVLQSQLSLHLEEHRKELAGVRVYTCKTCDKEFKTSLHLKEHMKSHTKMRSGGITDPIWFHLAESGGGWKSY